MSARSIYVISRSVSAAILAGWLPFAGELAAPTVAADPPAAVNSPLSPEESLKHFQLEPGLTIEIVAAEPQVVDPVSIAFDEDGRMYVVEMPDYPTGPKPGEPPLSQIKLLEDLDHDGRYETAHLFADKLLFATGVQPWQGGVIVTLAGEIAYLKDTDGDHKADLRETWFRGFVEQNPQLRANHPTFAPDNHIYVANGLRGGTIVANEEKWGKKYDPVSISGKDFRFNPLTGECEAVAGNGQFGMTFDDHGNRFICDNRHPCRQVMLEDRYTSRNPFLAIREVVHDVCAPAEQSRIYPVSKAWTTSNLHAGQFTAACGVLIYRGTESVGGFPGNVFICDPTGNLVHHDLIGFVSAKEIDTIEGSENSTSLAAYHTHERPDKKKEFLASDDEWFRPVDLVNGPDGALYVIDMYRAVIEHPEWVPDELKNRPDAWLGNDRGRIYRVRWPKVGAARRDKLPFARATPADLARLLKHANGWHRTTAARLLYERQDPSAVSALIDELKNAGEAGVGGVAILRSLDGLNALSQDMILDSLNCPNVLRQCEALRLSERRVKEMPQLQEALLSLPENSYVNSHSPSTFQYALSIGELPPSVKRSQRLVEIVTAPNMCRDEWLRRAVLTSLTSEPHLFLEQMLDARGFSGQWFHFLMLKELCELIGARQKADELMPTLAILASLPELKNASFVNRSTTLMLGGIVGLGQGLVRRGESFGAMLDRLESRESGMKAGLIPVFTAAARLAREPNARSELRAEAISALQFADFNTSGATLLELAKFETDQSLRLRAIDVLATFHDAEVSDRLIEIFATQTPAARRALLQAMLRDGERTKRLLAEIKAMRIAPTELDPLTVQALLNHKDAATREEAKLVLAALVPADRKQVLDQYQRALTLDADAKRGKLIFEKQCAACHKIAGVGVDVAPDISDSRTKTPAQLLADILNPNQAIDNNYVSYTVVTTDGKSEVGVISTETPASITLRQPEGKIVLILRQDIDELRSNGISLMPEGLEKNITVEQLADLISYIKNWRYLDGAVPTGASK